MRATRTVRSATRRGSRARKTATRRPVASSPGRPAKPVKPARPTPAVPQQVLFRLCKAAWAVVVEKTPTGVGTRFVCPFCPSSHRVSGPVRGFRKVRRAQWIKLRRVAE